VIIVLAVLLQMRLANRETRTRISRSPLTATGGPAGAAGVPTT
jgi:hypothetical protein